MLLVWLDVRMSVSNQSARFLGALLPVLDTLKLATVAGTVCSDLVGGCWVVWLFLSRPKNHKNNGLPSHEI